MTAPSSPRPTWNQIEPSASGLAPAACRLPSLEWPWLRDDVAFVRGVYTGSAPGWAPEAGDVELACSIWRSLFLMEASRCRMRALASRSLDSADVCVGQIQSSPDLRHPVQTGRFPLHLTFRDLQLKQANPYRRAFRAEEDAEPDSGPGSVP